MMETLSATERSFPRAEPTPQTPTQRLAVYSTAADFWMVGGASLILWLGAVLFSSLESTWSIRHHTMSMAEVAATLVLLVNYPHFMASYKIAYGRGWKFVKHFWFQLLLVPALLIGLFGLAMAYYSAPGFLPQSLDPQRMSMGEELCYLGISSMFLTVGWHYVRQVFGCMMTYSFYHRYPISRVQRYLILGLLYFMAFGSFMGGQAGPFHKDDYFGSPTFSGGVPYSTMLELQGIGLLLTGVFVYLVLYRNWKNARRVPPLNFLTPLIALMVWWSPFTIHYAFFPFLVPMFHSLQYIPFAARYEQGRMAERERKTWTVSWLVLGFIISGYLAFEFLPDMANTHLMLKGVKNPNFYLVFAAVFINVHHYFIDNTIWRFREQPELRRYFF